MTELTKHEERIRNRRQRRWKRRGRIIAPFAAIPLLLGTLLLSVDIIEYAPQEPPRSEQPNKQVRRQISRTQQSLAARAAIATSAVVHNKNLLEEDAGDMTNLRIEGSGAVPVKGLTPRDADGAR